MRSSLRFLDTAALTLYAAAVLVVVAHHEPWSDEAQSWMIARDLPFGKMLFHEMHYEVSPGLWQSILWLAQHIFHAPYAAMNYIGAAVAIAGAAVLIFYAPFPRIVRYLMAFSFYIVYQYAVIARPYNLLLLCAGGAAVFYRRRKLVPLAICLSFLTLVSLHGAILAGAIAAGAAWRELTEWKSLDLSRRRSTFIALAILCGAVILFFATAYPARDIAAINPLKGGGIHTLSSSLEHATVHAWYVAWPVLLLLGAFALWRREALVFVLGVGGLLGFQGLLYGAPHHEGAIVVAIIAALWVAYPSPDEHLPQWYRSWAIAGILTVVFAFQMFLAVKALRYDYATPYSGAADMAQFLHQIGAQPDETSGFTYYAVALQPYFDHNIFVNWPTAFVHHSIDSEPPLSKLRDQNLTHYLVITTITGDVDPIDQQLLRNGYIRRHVSPGRVLFDAGLWMTETFTLYEKVN